MMRSEARNTFGQQAAGQQQQSHERGAGDWTGYQPQSAVLASIAARQAGQASQPALSPAQPVPQPGQLQLPPDHPPAVAASAALTPPTDVAGHTADAAAVTKSRPAARPSYSSKPVLNETAQQQSAAGVMLYPPSLWCQGQVIICCLFQTWPDVNQWCSPCVVVDSGGAAAGKKALPPALLKRLQARGIAAVAAATEGAAAVPQTGGPVAQPSAEPGLQNGAPAAQPLFAPLASGPQGWLPVVVPTAVACSTLNGCVCVEYMSQRHTMLPIPGPHRLCCVRWPAAWLGRGAGHAVPHDLLLQHLDRRAHLAAPCHTGNAGAASRLGGGH